LGRRERGFVATREDYVAYEQLRSQLLRGRAGAAAMKAGGIVWRLAKDVVRIRDVLDGPSSRADWAGQSVDSERGMHLVDDALDSTELELICGVYRIETGHRVQVGEASWWPQQKTWRGSGVYHGQWTADNEAWFQSRLEKIRLEEAVPMKPGAWKELLRQNHKIIPRIIESTEASCRVWARSVVRGYVFVAGCG
ncbi:hypothetical protein BD779DRAFT_1458293, partial [Infundibulicybe gibba]